MESQFRIQRHVTFNKSVEDHIPLRKKAAKKPPWLKAGVKKSIRKKHHLFQRYRNTQQYKDYAEYRRQSNATKKKVRKAQADYERRIMKEFKNKPKAFYGYVRAKQKVKTGVSQLAKEDGDLTNTDKETADVLNSFFQSVFTVEPDGETPSLPRRKLDVDDIQSAEFTEEDVVEKLRQLKPDKSPGIDQVHLKKMSGQSHNAECFYVILDQPPIMHNAFIMTRINSANFLHTAEYMFTQALFEGHSLNSRI